MRIKPQRKIFLVFAFTLVLTAQMPGWKLFIDRDGNRYFHDENWKIYVDADSETKPGPISSRGLDYSINLADELLRIHRKSDALNIWKSILSLKPANMRIHRAQRIASEKIETMMRNEGTRFPEIDERSSHIFIKEDGIIKYINDHMRYSVEFEGQAVPLRKNFRRGNEHSYHGITIGVKTEKTAQAETVSYDYLAAFDSHRFKINIRDISEFEEYLGRVDKGGVDSKTILSSAKEQVLYAISARKPRAYSGFELYSISGNRGTIVRLIIPEEAFQEHSEKMLRTIESFRHVPVTRYP